MSYFGQLDKIIFKYIYLNGFQNNNACYLGHLHVSDNLLNSLTCIIYMILNFFLLLVY